MTRHVNWSAKSLEEPRQVGCARARCVLSLILAAGFLFSVLLSVRTCLAQTDGSGCEWADLPTIWGRVYQDQIPLIGVQVYIVNVTQAHPYPPYAPDPKCQMPIPETESHLCCYHGAGAWDSFWEKNGGDYRRGISVGDSLSAFARWNGQARVVGTIYNGASNFQMPDLRFHIEGP